MLAKILKAGSTRLQGVSQGPYGTGGNVHSALVSTNAGRVQPHPPAAHPQCSPWSRASQPWHWHLGPDNSSVSRRAERGEVGAALGMAGR